MKWKCPKCGFEEETPGSRCGGGCGYVRLAKRVVLTCESTNQQLRMHVNTAVGKSLLMRLDPADGVYASEPQFEIARDEALAAWVIRHDGSAKNPTFYNGEGLGDTPQTIADGGIISIGPDRLKLRVILEDA